jgi:hypothetical protein
MYIELCILSLSRMTKRLVMANLQCANVYVSTVEVVQYAPPPVLCVSHCPEIALLKKVGNFFPIQGSL